MPAWTPKQRGVPGGVPPRRHPIVVIGARVTAADFFNRRHGKIALRAFGKEKFTQCDRRHISRTRSLSSYLSEYWEALSMSHDLTRWIEHAEARQFRLEVSFDQGSVMPVRRHKRLSETIAKVPSLFHALTHGGYARTHHKC